MSPTPRIMRAGAEDAALLAALHHSAFAKSWPKESFAALLSNPHVLAFLASDGTGTARGDALIVVQCVAGEAEILTLATEPSRRRGGLARRLVLAAAREAHARGAAEMFLDVATGNAAACALYAGLGFAGQGLRRGYYKGRDGAEDALLLRASLPLEGAPGHETA
jgi:ribosomal-protein-alanine N-acetyltransferase